MASFQTLWDDSQAFRQLFLLNKVFLSSRHYDMGKAEHLWYERWPRVDWNLCAERGCRRLAPDNGKCGHHTVDQMPVWAWAKGILYRFMRTHVRDDGKLISAQSDNKDYKKYAVHQVEKAIGRIPDRFTFCCIDGNPFNLRTENMAIISKIAKAAILAGELTYERAVMMDEDLSNFFKKIGSRGRPRALWIYSFEHISQAAGVKQARVRQAVSRGKLDPYSLASVVDFCNSIAKSDKMIVGTR